VRYCATLKATDVNIFRASAVRRTLLQGVKALAGENPGPSYRYFLFQRAIWQHSGHQVKRFVAPIATFEFFDPVFAR